MAITPRASSSLSIRRLTGKRMTFEMLVLAPSVTAVVAGEPGRAVC
jgi:hypothetical protein